MKTKCEIHGVDLDDDYDECLLCWAAREASRHEAMLEYEQHRARLAKEREQAAPNSWRINESNRNT
jgi:hypothetical protein